jgi:acyl-CoA reductase-like NAD-dependent aldehyde dehydrogenase
MDGLIALNALGPAGAFRARRYVVVPDVRGQAAAQLSLLPDLFISRTVAALRKAATMPPDERVAALVGAAKLFATANLSGLTVTEHEHAASRVSGVPISVVRAATATVAERVRLAYDSAHHARPVGSVVDWRHPFTGTGGAVWTRRGDVFAVHAAGNHPGVHSLWPEALALGYRVAVRPSRREPFTPHRLVTALREAGFGADQVVLLPTDHSGADCILRAADLGMVYGGADVVRKYSGGGSVLPQGPGRSKILLTADVDWRDHLETIVESVVHHGGAGCVNATAVFVEDDPTSLAEAVAERLSGLPSLPPDVDQAVLPVHSVAQARSIERHLLGRTAGTRPWLGTNGVVDELGDGSAVLRPAVHQVDRPDAPQVSVELPFPCVWVAPWNRQAGVAPLRHSLVLTAMTHDQRLIDELVQEPTVANVYLGDHRTYEMAHGVPHDSYLADFLMRTKGVFRD